MTPESPYRLPSHLPVVTVDAHVLDEAHWTRVPVGTVTRWYHEAYILVPSAHWSLTQCAGAPVSGRTAYRSPASIRAWWRVARQWIARKLNRSHA